MIRDALLGAVSEKVAWVTSWCTGDGTHANDDPRVIHATCSP